MRVKLSKWTLAQLKRTNQRINKVECLKRCDASLISSVFQFSMMNVTLKVIAQEYDELTRIETRM